MRVQATCKSCENCQNGMSQGVKWCVTAQEGMSGQRMRSGLSSMSKMETHEFLDVLFTYTSTSERIKPFTGENPTFRIALK